MDERSKGVLLVVAGIVFGLLLMGAGVWWIGGIFVVIRGLKMALTPTPKHLRSTPIDITDRPSPFNPLRPPSQDQTSEPGSSSTNAD